MGCNGQPFWFCAEGNASIVREVFYDRILLAKRPRVFFKNFNAIHRFQPLLRISCFAISIAPLSSQISDFPDIPAPLHVQLEAKKLSHSLGET